MKEEKYANKRSGLRDFITDHLEDGKLYTTSDILDIWSNVPDARKLYRVRESQIAVMIRHGIETRLVRQGKTDGGAGKGHTTSIFKYVADESVANGPRNGKGFKQFIRDHCVVGQDYTSVKLLEIWDALENPEQYYGIKRDNLRWSLKNLADQKAGVRSLGVKDYEYKGARKPYLYRYEGV